MRVRPAADDDGPAESSCDQCAPKWLAPESDVSS